MPKDTAVQISRNRGTGLKKIGAFCGFRIGSGVEVGLSAVQVSWPKKWNLLGSGGELRRRLEWLIDPGEQVAIDEQLLAQQSGEIGQAPAKAGAQLQVLEHEQRNQGGPDLNLQGVGAGAHEGLDA